MPIGLIKDIANCAPKGHALLALDHGTRMIGLALSDCDWHMALPIGTLKRTRFTRDAGEIAKTIKTHDVGGLIVGLPLYLDGRMGPRAQSARDFATQLHRFLGDDVWIALQDERFSTAAAHQALGPNARLARAKSKGAIDTLAAQAILEAALRTLCAL